MYGHCWQNGLTSASLTELTKNVLNKCMFGIISPSGSSLGSPTTVIGLGCSMSILRQVMLPGVSVASARLLLECENPEAVYCDVLKLSMLFSVWSMADFALTGVNTTKEL